LFNPVLFRRSKGKKYLNLPYLPSYWPQLRLDHSLNLGTISRKKLRMFDKLVAPTAGEYGKHLATLFKDSFSTSRSCLSWLSLLLA